MEDESTQTHPAAEALILDWIQHDTRARLLLNSRGELIWANRSAMAEIEAGEALTLVSQRLRARNLRHQPALDAFLSSRGEQWQRHFLSLPDEKHHLILEARAMPLGEGSHLALQLRRTDRGIAAEPEHMFQAFQLTPSERMILLQLLEGASAPQIAAARRASTDTIRVHVRNIYAKLQVDSRGKLLRRLMPYIC